MQKKKIKKRVSIRSRILLLFIMFIFALVIVIGLTVFANWISFAQRNIEIISKDMNREISSQIDDLLYVPYHINEVNHKMISNDILDLANEQEREKFFIGVLQSHSDQIYSFSYGTEEGEYYGARHNEQNQLEIMKNNSETGGQSWYYSVTKDSTSDQLVMKTGLFDPRTRDWYIKAKEKGAATYSSIYKHFVMDDLVVSSSWPIYDSSGKLEGVMGSHMLLSDIDDYLTRIVADKKSMAFIIQPETEELIGNSIGAENFKIQEDGSLFRNTLTDLDTDGVQQAYERYKRERKEYFLFQGEEDSYYINVLDYSREGLNWIIITAIPEGYFLEDIVVNIRTTVLVILIILLFSIVVYYLGTYYMLKPMSKLIAAMEGLSAGDLRKRVSIIRKDEIGIISVMFNHMADKMQQLVDNLEDSVKERTSMLTEANDSLQRIKDDLYLILDSTAEGIYGLDTNGNCTFCNNRCIEILGYKQQKELIGKNMHALIHHSNREGQYIEEADCKMRNAYVNGSYAHESNEVFWRRDNTCFDTEYHAYPQIKEGKLVGAVVTFMDITERKKSEEQIQYLSYHDALTGLMNRRCLEDSLKKYDVPSSLPISVIFADLNGLKLINDVFGHSSGDALIKKAADILIKSCRSQDLIARMGGDEFIVLLLNTEAEEAETIVNRVRDELTKETVNGLPCSMALGFDTKTASYQDIEKVIGNAEGEMYQEKSNSRNSFARDTITSIIKALQDRNPTEKSHSENVAQLCDRMGQALGMTGTEAKKLRDAAYLHDIGKIVMEDNLLLKQGKLSEYENQLMMQHTIVGYRILNLFDETLDLANDVYAHHERWDGTGYPKGLKGEEIPTNARIISLIECYDRKLSELPEKDNKATMRILTELEEEAGAAYDPQLTKVFLQMMRG